MKNKEEIDKICRKANKLRLTQEWLRILFFVAVIIVTIVYYKAISFAVTVSDPLLTMKYDRIAGATIIITLSVFAGLLMSGYFYNQYLSRKLDQLWDEKKLLF